MSFIRIVGASYGDYSDIYTQVIDIPDLKEIQQVVGGYIETLVSVPSEERDGYTVAAYVDEDGISKGLELTGAIEGRPFLGRAMIVGVDPDGETCLLTRAEALQMRVQLVNKIQLEEGIDS